MEKVFCNLCGSKKYTEFLTNLKSFEFDEKFTLVKCSRCGLVFINPRPTKRNISKYYLTSNYFSDSSQAFLEYSFLYKMIFKKIEKGNVFDIGAGTGLFLTEFQKRGWKVGGLEPSLVARKIARKKFGITLKSGDLLDVDFRNKYFDLMVLNNVIEHLHKPKETLKKVSHHVKKGGFVLISCPNINSIGGLLFGRKWYGVDAPRHLYQFNPTTLGKLLESSGFKVIDVSYSFYRHNYLVLFESFRRSLSPRFNETRGNNHLSESNVAATESKQSLIKKIGIVVSKISSLTIAYIEPLIGRGEIMTFLAVKS